MVGRKCGSPLGMGAGYEELLESTGEHARCQAIGEIETAKRDLYVGLPSRRHAHEHQIRCRDAASRNGAQPGRLAAPPEEDVSVEQEPVGRLHSRPSNAAWISGGSGASKSSAMRIRPSQPPGWRGRAGRLNGTSLARGLPALARMISSPSAARSTSREREVFASYKL